MVAKSALAKAVDRYLAPQFVEEVLEHHDLMLRLGLFRGQDFDGDFAMEFAVARAIHLAHAARDVRSPGGASQRSSNAVPSPILRSPGSEVNLKCVRVADNPGAIRLYTSKTSNYCIEQRKTDFGLDD